MREQHGASYCIGSSTCVCLCACARACERCLGKQPLRVVPSVCPAIRPSVCRADKHPDLLEDGGRGGTCSKEAIFKMCMRGFRVCQKTLRPTAPHPSSKAISRPFILQSIPVISSGLLLFFVYVCVHFLKLNVMLWLTTAQVELPL